ncbi:hypothetical protein [Streptomyces sp. Tu 3180]|uniref:hypothetical protein n=1 Tax=Streptomyces sp. Tu 3180 TaxID=2682611 RepID=UPI00135B4C08|nr:hypothetical protein [Streptomyces sp. Tu 3180]KAF3465467.1 hypothetical protein GL259_14720 [Streptomyces sp. Tu 3180]
MNDEHEPDEGSGDEDLVKALERFRGSMDPLIKWQQNWARNMFPPISRMLQESAAFRLNLTKNIPTIVPPLAAQVTQLQEQLRGMHAFNSSLRTLIESVNRSYAPQWERIFESIRDFQSRIFPENWEGVNRPGVAEFESLLIDEGIALMWVPGPKAIQALLDASTAAERRRIISRRWKGIVTDCEVALSDVTHPSLQEPKKFGLDCVRALQEGHAAPAQALAGNLLDSVLRSNFDNADRLKVTRNNFKNNGVRFNLDDYKIRAAFTFAPVWCAHAKYKTEDGDPIPRTFGRHPTTHAVSLAQYSRINAVMGLMLVTSVIKFFDTEMEWPIKRVP